MAELTDKDGVQKPSQDELLNALCDLWDGYPPSREAVHNRTGLPVEECDKIADVIKRARLFWDPNHK